MIQRHEEVGVDCLMAQRLASSPQPARGQNDRRIATWRQRAEDDEHRQQRKWKGKTTQKNIKLVNRSFFFVFRFILPLETIVHQAYQIVQDRLSSFCLDRCEKLFQHSPGLSNCLIHVRAFMCKQSLPRRLIPRTIGKVL